MHFLLGLILSTLALFLIMIILVQRGRGGGLSGALGGMGGQSAFGTKAGDAFTKITVGMSIAWIVMCIITSLALGRGGSAFDSGEIPPASTPPVPGMTGTGAGTPGVDGTLGSDAEVSTDGGILGGNTDAIQTDVTEGTETTDSSADDAANENPSPNSSPESSPESSPNP